MTVNSHIFVRPECHADIVQVSTCIVWTFPRLTSLHSALHQPIFSHHLSLSTLLLSSIFLSSSSSSSACLPSSFFSSLSSSAVRLNLEVTTVAGWHGGLNKTRTIASPLLSSSHPLISPFNRLPLFSPFTVALSGSLLAMLMKVGLVWV